MPNQDAETTARSRFNILWICDCSSSMKGKGKAGSMNTIIREIVQELAEIPDESPTADIFLRAIKFSDAAEWIQSSFIPVQEFQWHDLQPGGRSNLGNAFTEISREFITNTPQKGDALLSILISDGYPTDEWQDPLSKMKRTLQDWSPIYCAVLIQDSDDVVIEKFAGNSEDSDMRVMEMDNIENIIQIVRAAVLDE